MKLKKIASLMLAGIMAVSMLAACGEGKKDDDSSSSSSSQVTVSNVVSFANGALSGAEKKVYTFHDNEELNKALQAVATDKTKCTAKKIEDAYAEYDWNNDGDLRSAVKGKMSGSITFQDNYTMFGAAATVPTNNAKTLNYVEVALLSGELSEKAVAEIAAEYFAGYMGSLNDIDNTATYDFDYSADISAIKVTSPQDSNKTAWVLSVMITKTAAESANA